jgi:hypothetical protein
MRLGASRRSVIADKTVNGAPLMAVPRSAALAAASLPKLENNTVVSPTCEAGMNVSISSD